MKKTSTFLIIVSVTLMLILGHFDIKAQSVYTDYDTKADFKQYKTYAWLAPGDSVLNGKRLDKVYAGYIMHSANNELKEKGMVMSTDHPDAIFIFGTQVRDKTEYSQSPTLSIGVGVAGPGYYMAGSAPVAGGQITETTVTDGALTFDMYDGKTGKLVWAGGANKTFGIADDVEKIIADYSKKILKKLPIKIK